MNTNNIYTFYEKTYSSYKDYWFTNLKETDCYYLFLDINNINKSSFIHYDPVHYKISDLEKKNTFIMTDNIKQLLESNDMLNKTLAIEIIKTKINGSSK